MKSVATARRWPNRSHRDVEKNAQRLIDHSDDPDFYQAQFALVETLHINFYEEKYGEQKVRRGLRAARRLIEGMKAAESRLPAATR